MSTATAASRPGSDLARSFLALLFLSLLIGSVFWILRPFLGALLWAATIVVATWPMREGLARRLGDRPRLATTLLTVGLVLVFMVPLFVTMGTLVSHSEQITAQAKALLAGGFPVAPAWLERLPAVGTPLAAAWNALAASPLADLGGQLTPYMGDVASWFAGQVGGLGRLMVQFFLTVVIAGVLWSSGEVWAAGLMRFAHRLGGASGEGVVRLAGQAVRAVALGVVVTAIVQAVLAGIGLGLAGIPLAMVLTVVMFLLAIAQLGPLPILLPAVGWLFYQGSTGWGIFLLVWSLVVGTMDNFLRPVLIRRGADLPLLLVFAGVLGGLMSFGLVGLFIGPVVLAVAHTLWNAWVGEAPAAATPAGEAPASS